MIRVVVLVFLLLSCQASQAGSGQLLLNECTAFVNGDHTSQEKALGISVPLWSGCPGSFSAALSTDAEHSLFRKVCLPKEVKNGQLAKIMVKYLTDHPESLHRDEFELVREVFHIHFPCSITDQLRHWKIIDR
jgi:hypothetical protein